MTVAFFCPEIWKYNINKVKDFRLGVSALEPSAHPVTFPNQVLQ